MQYFRYLHEERQTPRTQRGESAYSRALERTAETLGYSLATTRTYLERGVQLHRELTALWSRRGAEWISAY